MIRKKFLALAVLFLNLGLVIAQKPQQPAPPPPKPPSQTQTPPEIDSQDVVKITTNLVQVDAVVTKDGKQVTDLTANDFELLEDGKPQTITNFSYISNIVPAPLPATASVKEKTPRDKLAPPIPPAVLRPQDPRRTIALVIDDMGMSAPSVAIARQQARKFVREQLQPNDLVAIIRTSGEVGSLQQFTTNRRMLENAIDKLRWYPSSRAGQQVFAPMGGLFGAAPGDAFFNGRSISGTLQVLKFIVEGMRDLSGRKSLVVMSDMLPIETQEPGTVNLTPGDGTLADERLSYLAQLKKVAELAIRGSVVIYSVDTTGLVYTGLTAADNLATISRSQINSQINDLMSSRSWQLFTNRQGGDLIARQTGGFQVRNSNDFGLKRIVEDQNGYYLLAYRPTDQTFNRKFHHLKVVVKRHGLVVRTREGFFGIDEASVRPPELTAGDQMKKALMSPFGANEITVRLTTLFTNFTDGSLLRSLLYIDPQNLTFEDESGGSHVANFDLGIVLFGENGRLVDQQSRLVTLRLNKDTYDSALRSGIVYELDTPLKQAGAFQFRVALRDRTSSKIGSAGEFVEVPNLTNGRVALSGLVLLKEMLDKPDNATVTQQDARDTIIAGPAVRQFHQGDKLIFAYSIYNAQQHATTHQPQLVTQARLFRDGKLLFTGNRTPLEANGQTDLKRIPGVGRLQLGTDYSPGEYVLQVLVTDQLAKEKQQIATQWIDFEIVK
ncbi:MAG TPA: VWA domain-containing protein [Pyrinomonadaceae bacterium]|jgi:VWFA-related protein|nr:VWA domain-containing protein [Pyrinomonadaceae bacterium]